jgi:phosphopantothenoylcysteine decarboxylase/phosphopantothenate--cysteine ligase
MAQVDQTLKDRKILLIVGGGIAAYKALDLIRRLRERGGQVRVVLTAAGRAFVTPLSLASLSGQPVHEDLFSLTDETEMGHIELSRSADLVVVAPATADLMAKAANGLANDLASTLLLATDKKVLMAPAMNVRMWLHPATRRNAARLIADGILFTGPADGDMACGEFGPGRMSEPLEIVAAVTQALSGDTRLPLNGDVAAPASLLKGRRIVITSGPTHEPIDPVRYIANRSSGRQGHAIAQAAARAGAHVVLISGPVSIPDPVGVEMRRVETARDMLSAVEAALPADVFIGAAAVADWRVEGTSDSKIKKTPAGSPSLKLAENPDILAQVSALSSGRPQLVVGFAAETNDLLDHARAKLTRKGCDLIIANDVGAGSNVMGGTHNKVHLVSHTGVDSWPLLDKDEVASRLIARCAELLAGAEPE